MCCFRLIKSVHVLSICLVVGSILAVDLRLLGLASVHRSVSRVTRGILPLTWGAFAVAVASGGLMFISNATKYLGNGFFVAKMLLIGAAGLNMVIFHAIGAKNLPRWENRRQAATAGKARGRAVDSAVGLWWSRAGAGSALPCRPDEMNAVALPSRCFCCGRYRLRGRIAFGWRRRRADAAVPAYVDMKTFMEHVLTPAAKIVWSVNGVVIDAKDEHDLAPKSDADWEQIVSGAATLAEATNALMIPQRALDPEWNGYARKLGRPRTRPTSPRKPTT